MTTLRQAAQAVLARWDSLSWQWSEKSPTADLMAALRTALEQEHALHELARPGQEIEQGKRGSIALARSLCYQINGAADDSDDIDGGGYGSVDVAEILSAEVERLREALAKPVLQDIEQYRMQIAGICTAAIGYWKNGDGIHPDYDTLALRDVAKLYAKYDALYKAQPVFDCPRCGHVCSQRLWVDLTDEDWEKVANRKGTSLDTFDQGAAWAQQRLKERNT